MIEQIFKLLEDDARTTTEKIATMTGIPENKVAAVIKQAEKDRTILKYKTIINWDKVRDEHVTALIEVKVTPQREVGFDAIAERIYRFPQAHTVYLLSGTYDLLVIVNGKTMHEIADFVAQKLAPIEGVQSTTHFMLKRYKEDGEVIEAAEEVKRQQISL